MRGATILVLTALIPATAEPRELPAAYAGQPYNLPLGIQLTGTFPWKFEMSGPAWLAIDPRTAVLTGTPTAADPLGTAVSITATDSSIPAKTITATLVLRVFAQLPRFDILSVTPAVTPDAALADWGRIRAYFSAGAVLSRDSEFKSQSDVFFSFNLDKNWRWSGFTAENKIAHRVMWNTFFEARLTDVPESRELTAVGRLAAYIGPRRAAQLQAGNYFPIVATHWTFQNDPHALFIAPLAKAGFITPTGPSPNTAERPVNPEQFYTHYGFGLRMGHFRMSRNTNVAPELISYLDVTMGRFSNLDVLAAGLTGAGIPMTYPRRPYRIAMEGLLRVPGTPLALGFAANAGQNLLLEKRVRSAKDDLQFFIGTRFDVGKLIGQLQQFH